MIVFAPLLVLVGIGFFCWLLFTLAVFALPLFVGLTIGIGAFHTGAGAIGGAAAGLVAARRKHWHWLTRAHLRAVDVA
ncbi:hypothetical protein [Bradyrhizobium neotropicale]|uniref:hypothetical protein n=1 Tax=Bradyrhizobium neotropicale TaxID=1497615 RepID=UPI002897E198|nr:hypothetical protein [Bradyrhizobium neotropicale]